MSASVHSRRCDLARILSPAMSANDLRLFRAGVESLGSDDPVNVVRNMVALAADGAGASSASLYLLEDDGKLHPWHVIGLSPEYVEACGPVAVGEQCCG